jgi:hypothetical protein
MDIVTVKDLVDHLETHFQDDDKLKFHVSLDGGHRTTYYGNESVFINFLEYSGLGEGDCEIHLTGDVDEEG